MAMRKCALWPGKFRKCLDNLPREAYTLEVYVRIGTVVKVLRSLAVKSKSEVKPDENQCAPKLFATEHCLGAVRVLMDSEQCSGETVWKNVNL